MHAYISIGTFCLFKWHSKFYKSALSHGRLVRQHSALRCYLLNLHHFSRLCLLRHWETLCFVCFPYLAVLHGFVYGRVAVRLVQLGGLTHHTDGLLVVQTEELQFLPVQTAVQLFVQQRALPFDLHEGLADILQGQVWGDVGLEGFFPAHRALAYPRVPAALQTASAEAVATRQQNGVRKDVTTYRAREILLWKWHGHHLVLSIHQIHRFKTKRVLRFKSYMIPLPKTYLAVRRESSQPKAQNRSCLPIVLDVKWRMLSCLRLLWE